MWTRKELKEKGKKGFNRNYWKTVLVSLIALFVLGGTVGGSSGAWSPISGVFSMGSSAASGTAASSFVKEADDYLDEAAGGADDLEDYLDDHGYDGLDDFIQHHVQGDVTHEDIHDFFNGAGSIFGTALGIMLIIIAAIVLLIIIAIVILISAFLENPLHVGLSRFFIRNLNTEAEVKEIAYGYDHGYLNNVKVMFFKGLYTFFWSLLFIIPGIIKSYEYRMIPYILAENPDMDMKAVFAKSKAMMTGQKWKAFVLDLSFIGWEILSVLTLGLLGIFYVNPYRNTTYAALYEALEYGPGDGETAYIPSDADAAISSIPAEDTTWNSETTY